MKKREILFCYFMLISIIAVSFTSTEIVKGKGSTVVETVENEVKTVYNQGDLTWSSGVQYFTGGVYTFNPTTTSAFSFNTDGTTFHIAETTGALQHDTFWYTNIPVVDGSFSVSFEARIKSVGYQAHQTHIRIFDNTTKQMIRMTGCYRYHTDTVSYDSGFNFFNFTYFVGDVTSVIIMFNMRDSWSYDWQQEYWIRSVQVTTPIEPSSLLGGHLIQVHELKYSQTRGLFWKNGRLLNLGHNASTYTIHLFEINPISGEIVSTTPITFDPHSLTFDGTYYWTYDLYWSGYIHYDLQKYDDSFSLLSSQSLDIPAVTTDHEGSAGITFDGTNLWIGEHREDKIYLVDRDTANNIRTIPTPGPRISGLEYKDGYLWACDQQEDKIYKISPADGSILESFDSYCHAPWGLTIDNEGYIWISSYADSCIYKTTINTYPDADSPVLTSSGDLEYTSDTVGNYISWTLADTYPDSYEVYRNGVLITSGTWLSGENISVNVDYLQVGTYNYTIVAQDLYDHEASSTIWVTVIELEETSFGWISISFILFISVFSTIWRRKKK